VRETVSRSIQLAIGRVPGPAPKRNFIRKVLGGRLEHSMQVRELLLQARLKQHVGVLTVYQESTILSRCTWAIWRKPNRKLCKYPRPNILKR